jgi:hypothetical protein
MTMVAQYLLFAFSLTCFAKSITQYQGLGYIAIWLVYIYIYAFWIAQGAAKPPGPIRKFHRPSVNWDRKGWHMDDRSTPAQLDMWFCCGLAIHPDNLAVKMLVVIVGPLQVAMIVDHIEEPSCKSTPAAPLAGSL